MTYQEFRSGGTLSVILVRLATMIFFCNQYVNVESGWGGQDEVLGEEHEEVEGEDRRLCSRSYSRKLGKNLEIISWKLCGSLRLSCLMREPM